MKATFDRKFGKDFVANVPTTAGVYLFRTADRVIYVGKAKNLRRRIATYRNTTRRKVHRKQRTIVRDATSLEIRQLASEREALLVENELIRTLRPKHNVDGKFDFLYPSIGVGAVDRCTVLCYTADVEAFFALELSWFGCFRSRLRTREAFDACVEIVGFLGHAQRVEAPRRRGSSTRGFRQLPRLIVDELEDYFAGRDPRVLRSLSVALLDKPAARRESARVQECLQILTSFFETDLAPLRAALIADGRESTHVEQTERDALFLRVG